MKKLGKFHLQGKESKELHMEMLKLGLRWNMLTFSLLWKLRGIFRGASSSRTRECHTSNKNKNINLTANTFHFIFFNSKLPTYNISMERMITYLKRQKERNMKKLNSFKAPSSS